MADFGAEEQNNIPCAASDGWDLISDVSESGLAVFLERNGLAKHVEKLIEVMEADTVGDLKLIDSAMMEEIIEAAGLKMLSAKKFRLAIGSLHAAAQGPLVQTVDTGASDDAQPEPCSVTDLGLEVAPETIPEEVVVLCIDRSGSMKAPFLEAAAWADAGDHVEQLRRTRMDAVKQMFYAFRDRTESSGKHHLLGLVQFDDRIETMLEPTSRLDSFERIVDDMQPRGQTAIYSALQHAADILSGFNNITLRIVALTDGQSNSGLSAESALGRVRSLGAVVDAIIVGDRPDDKLRRIVAATGGECWQIRDTTEGFELLEAESVVSLAARGGPRPVDSRALDEIKGQELTRPDVAKRQRPVVNIGKVADVQTAAQKAEKCDQVSQKNLARVLKELRMVAEGNASAWMHSGEGIHIFPSEDLNVWRCLIEGPAGSPFQGGVFPVTVHIPASYPFAPPKIRFEVPVYHCNISESGQPCLDILDGSWSPSLTVPKALESLRILLAQPDPNNALRQWVAELTLAFNNTQGADSRYRDEACAHTLTHASKSVDEWKAVWNA